MYYYLFFLITDDVARNRKLADLMLVEQKKDTAVKLAVYDSLPAALQHKALYDLLELEKVLTEYNVLTTALPKIDH
ncbi:hypothetical protein HDU90_002919 [Geranomyces variabilis]|nr:hypothetical protein HDU90_002919 [Geranomyces variabilis]